MTAEDATCYVAQLQAKAEILRLLIAADRYASASELEAQAVSMASELIHAVPGVGEP
jgi:glutamate/tyrosine decarboxylase-like PLP-dependent enzyme